jgi:hypothetical protein
VALITRPVAIMANELTQLETQRAEIVGRISEIEFARDEEKSAEFVGRYFKYRNSYSCPEKPSDYWHLYFKVTGYEGRRLKGYSFEQDKYGKFFFDPNAETFHHLTRYEEIEADEFARARSSFLSRLTEKAA